MLEFAVPKRSAAIRPGLRRHLRSLIVTVLFLALLAMINALLLRVFVVPSGSMQPTFHPGSRVVVDETVPRWRLLHHGDVVVFVDPGGWVNQQDLFAAPNGIGLASPDPFRQILGALGLPGSGQTYLVKRVIGLPGDHLASDDQGHLTVNGHMLMEPYLEGGSPGRTAFSIRVPAGTLWVMGDNRLASMDSRFQQATPSHGFVPESNVIGRVFASF